MTPPLLFIDPVVVAHMIKAKAIGPRIVAGVHFGLHGMRERVVSLNGLISIESSPEAGTPIYVAIPVKKGVG